MADVSSVLEDVSNELCDIQIKRVASVIERLEKNKKIDNDNKPPEDESDNDDELNSSKLNFSFSSPKVSTPVRHLTEAIPAKSPASPNIDELTYVVGQELLKLEAERKMKVQTRIKERKEKLLQELELQKIQRQKDAEKVERIMQVKLAQMEAKEREAEERCMALKSEVDVRHQQELMARKAREAQIEADLQKARQIEAAKAAKQKTLVDQISSQSQKVTGLLDSLFSLVNPEIIDTTLKPIGLDSKNLRHFLQNASGYKTETQENTLAILISLYNAFTRFIKDAEEVKALKDQVKAEEDRKAKEAEMLKKKAETEAKAKIEEEKRKLAAEAQVAAQKLTVTSSSSQQISISPANEHMVKTVTEFRDNYLAQLQQMNIDKNFKFTCQKAVTTPLNAISDVTADHLKDKLTKLIALTNGEPVQATENTRFQASSMPELIYAKNLLAKKLIR